MIHWEALAAPVKPVRLGPAVVSAAFDAEGVVVAALIFLVGREPGEGAFGSAVVPGLCGLPSTATLKTLCRFRLALVAAGLPKRLFTELDRLQGAHRGRPEHRSDPRRHSYWCRRGRRPCRRRDRLRKGDRDKRAIRS
jgi:hypothetical protein